MAVVENTQVQLRRAPKNRNWDAARWWNPGHFSWGGTVTKNTYTAEAQILQNLSVGTSETKIRANLKMWMLMSASHFTNLFRDRKSTRTKSENLLKVPIIYGAANYEEKV